MATESSRLFEAARHEPLRAAAWSEVTARAAMVRIADAAFDAFEPGLGWRTHPLDDPRSADEHLQFLFCGAGGVVCALEHLAHAGAIERRIDFSPFVHGIVERQRALAEPAPHGAQGFLLGEAGLLALQWKFQPDEGVAARLLDVVRHNLHNPTLEPLWGSSGTLLTAVFMAEATGRAEWATVLREGVQILWQQMEPCAAADSAWLWVQDMVGHREPLLGAGHGLAGNVFTVLRGADWLDAAVLQAYLDRALHTLQATAMHEGGCINWLPEVLPPALARSKRLVQDCHGAPGILSRFAQAPRSADWDELLQGAGELTWRAGPLAKGASVCHGTAGSALALLRLWRRSGQPQWLERARALAMHAIEQVERHRRQYGVGRHSLWTGDLGLACVLWGCVSGRDEFPTLDLL